jgi:thioredoxin-dependent peroxiredoxin
MPKPATPDPLLGRKAPDFKLKDHEGSEVRLSSLKGRPVVLYFYPADFTPGCTQQACDFRDAYAALKKTGAVLLGLSPDDSASHAKFRAKHQLPFPLLADADHKTAEAYGAWGEKVLYGRRFQGLIRSTFVVDKDGKVAAAFRKVRVDGHSEKVLEALKALP